MSPVSGGTPEADIRIDAALVERLVRTQHPDLAGPVTLVENGWDNDIYRLGDDLCVRLPRREAAAGLILNEQRWLPELARSLPVPVPAPERIGVPQDEYPWAWTICRWIDGTTALEVEPSNRLPAAEGLAEFFATLHIPAPADAPRNPVRGVPLASRAVAVEERLATGRIPHSNELGLLWRELVATPTWDGPPLWLHGDPHPGNLLLDPRTKRLAAVIDFGDLTAGDPATDLCAAWLVFDPEGRAAFRTHMNEFTATNENTWRRARGWALVVGTALALGTDRVSAIGDRVLEQVLLEE